MTSAIIRESDSLTRTDRDYECWRALTGYVSLDRYCDVLDNFLEHLICLLGLLQRRSVEIIDDHALGEDRHNQRLGVFRNAERAPFQEGHRLSGAVEGLRSPRRNAQGKEL